MTGLHAIDEHPGFLGERHRHVGDPRIAAGRLYPCRVTVKTDPCDVVVWQPALAGEVLAAAVPGSEANGAGPRSQPCLAPEAAITVNSVTGSGT